jgi:hypothetical protein
LDPIPGIFAGVMISDEGELLESSLRGKSSGDRAVERAVFRLRGPGVA